MTGPGGRDGLGGRPSSADRLGELAVWLRRTTGGDPPRTRLVVLGAEPAEDLLTLAHLQSVPVRPVPLDELVRTEPDDSGDTDSGSGAEPPDGHEPGALAVALTAGADLVDAEVDSGTGLLALAAPGDAASAGLAAIARLLNRDPVAVSGYGYGVPTADWVARVRAVRDRMRPAGGNAAADWPTLLAALNSPVLAAVAGFLRQAVVRRTPVVLDGPAPAAAALLVGRESDDAGDPDDTAAATSWWLPAHAGTPGEREAYAALGLAPLLDLGLDRVDGLGALLTLPILTAAAVVAGG